MARFLPATDIRKGVHLASEGRFSWSTRSSRSRRTGFLLAVAVVAWIPGAPGLATGTATSVPNGVIAFTSDRPGNREIYVINQDGTGLMNLSRNTADELEPAWSPDGTQVAFVSNRDGNREIYVMNADGTSQRNLTNHPADEYSPSWSPNGQRLAFTSYRDGKSEIYVMNADGTGAGQLTDSTEGNFEPAWAPSGNTIAFVSTRDGNSEIYEMNADGSGETNLTLDPDADYDPSWAPDGSKIAFESYRGFNFDVYVMNADGSNQSRLTEDQEPDLDPTWAPDGTKIAFQSYRDHNNEIYTMNTDGSAETNVTQAATDEYEPSWQTMAPLLASSVSVLLAENKRVKEGRPVRFVIEVRNIGPDPMEFEYETLKGSAKARKDFLPRTGTLVFGPWVQHGHIKIRTRQDRSDERNERFFLRLSDAGGGYILFKATIKDND